MKPRGFLALALVVILVGLGLPAHWFARRIAPAELSHAAWLVQGTWVLKGTLVHAGCLGLFAVRRMASRHDGAIYQPLSSELAHAIPYGSLRERAAMVVLLIVAGLARLMWLSSDLSVREVDLFLLARDSSALELWCDYSQAGDQRGYALLARASLAIFGPSSAALRAPALLLGFASVLAFWRVALLFAPRTQAFWATAILALSAPHVWFSQHASGHTGMLCFSLLATGELARLLGSKPLRPELCALRYGLWMGLAVWLHPMALLVGFSHACVYIALLGSRACPRRSPGRRIPAAALLGAGFAALLALAPVLPHALHTFLEAQRHIGPEARWKGAQQLWHLLPFERAGQPAWAIAVGLALLVVALILGARSFLLQGLLSRWLLVGAQLLVLASLLALGILEHPMLLAATGVGSLHFVRGLSCWVRLFLRPQVLGELVIGFERALFSLACGICAAGLARAWGPKQDFTGAKAWIESQAVDPTAVVTVGRARKVYDQMYTTDWQSAGSLAELVQLQNRHPTLWVVATSPSDLREHSADLWRHLTREYELVSTFEGTLPGGEVCIYAWPSSPW